MPIHKLTYDGIDSRFPVVYGSEDRFFDTGTWGLTGTTEEICAELKVRGQALSDHAIPLAELPADDPAKTTNPNTTREMWDATNTYLLSRTIEVVDVSWDGAKYVCTLRRVD